MTERQKYLNIFKLKLIFHRPCFFIFYFYLFPSSNGDFDTNADNTKKQFLFSLNCEKKSSQLIPLRLLEIKSVEILAISFLLIVLKFGYFSLYQFFLFSVHLFNDKILPLFKKKAYISLNSTCLNLFDISNLSLFLEI